MKKLFLLLISLLLLTLISCASEDKENINVVNTESPSLSNKQRKEPEDFEEPLVRDLYDDSDLYSLINDQNKESNLEKINDSNESENTQSVNNNLKNDNSETNEIKKAEKTPTSSIEKGNKENTKNLSSKEIKEKTNKNIDSSNNINEINNESKNDNKIENKSQEIKRQNKTTNSTETKKDNNKENKSKDYSTEKNAGTNKSSLKQNNQNKENNTTKTSNSENKNKEDSFFVIPEEIENEIKKIDEEQKKILNPSRKVKMNKNETLSVTYPGTGWIYLGSTSEYNNLTSTSKQTINNETIYTLIAKEEGTQIHHFYKHDKITGKFIDDYLEVEVSADNGSVYTINKAPEYKDIVPKRPETPAKASKKDFPQENENLINENTTPTKKETQFINQSEIEKKEIIPNEKRDFIEYTPESEQTENLTNNEQITKENIKNDYKEINDATELLTYAQKSLDEKKFEEAANYLSRFFEISTENRDYGLYLQGQLYEQDSSLKDVKKSISSYQNLIDNYPESIYYDKANKRIIYLKRFYIDIR